MLAETVKFKGHRCFKNEWSGFEKILPINVIIGRNNTGKSHLLDLVAALCDSRFIRKGWNYSCSGVLDEQSLQMQFSAATVGGMLEGNHWESHGKWFRGIPISWEINDGQIDVRFPKEFDFKSPFGFHSTEARVQKIKAIAEAAGNPLSNTIFTRLFADRDIRPEKEAVELKLHQNGAGATNIIRRYIVTTSPKFPRELIQRDLLQSLNEIFGRDGNFAEIQVKIHDESSSDFPEGVWEVFLGESKKGLVPLSRSGSGLKTVLLVLLNLLVVPQILGIDRSKFTFAFEELENNLHPALLRRLFQYLENYAVKEGCKVFLTTHSSTSLDLFGISKNAQIIHVTHDGISARAQTVSAHFDHLGVISELGAKPSDLLQANGIIWVEGPSDCIYLNRWIDLISNGELQEGRDYLCAFYGGSLLARTQFTSPDKAEKELINLFGVNPNIVVICDGDRSRPGARVKDRVRRISSEVRKIPNAHIWVTIAREIENYTTGEVLAKALSISRPPNPTQYEPFFPRKGQPRNSYLERKLNRKSFDKMDLAILSVPHMSHSALQSRFDWKPQMDQIVSRIRLWNAK